MKTKGKTMSNKGFSGNKRLNQETSDKVYILPIARKLKDKDCVGLEIARKREIYELYFHTKKKRFCIAQCDEREGLLALLATFTKGIPMKSNINNTISLESELSFKVRSMGD